VNFQDELTKYSFYIRFPPVVFSKDLKQIQFLERLIAKVAISLDNGAGKNITSGSLYIALEWTQRQAIYQK